MILFYHILPIQNILHKAFFFSDKMNNNIITRLKKKLTILMFVFSPSFFFVNCTIVFFPPPPTCEEEKDILMLTLNWRFLASIDNKTVDYYCFPLCTIIYEKMCKGELGSSYNFFFCGLINEPTSPHLALDMPGQSLRYGEDRL